MAKRKLAKPEAIDQHVSPDERLARVTALAAIRDFGSGEQVAFLRSCGFSISDTAKMLMMSENQVSVSMLRTKKALQKGNKPSYLTAKKNAQVQPYRNREDR